jgi:Uma2 family endonuclease
VVRTAREGIISERGIEGAPDWVIEILSPATERVDRERKHKLYAEFGVQEYWLVDPKAQRVEVMTLTPNGFGPARIYGARAKRPGRRASRS